jgi:hypothetical protein
MRVTVEFTNGDEIVSDELVEVTNHKQYIESFSDEIGVVIHTGDWVHIIPWTSIRQIWIPKVTEE